MIEINYLNNQFIVAMPALADPVFSHTVTFLCQHTKDGALGIMINRPVNMTLGEIFTQMNIPIKSLIAAESPVFSGASLFIKSEALSCTHQVSVGKPQCRYLRTFI